MELCQILAGVPGKDNGEKPGAQKAFPRLVGAERQKGSAYEFASQGHAAGVGHDIIDNDQTDGQDEPNQAVENIVHDILQLPHGQTQDHNGPTQLIDLKANMTGLQRGNGQHQRGGIQHKGQRSRVLDVAQKLVQLGIVLKRVADKVAVGVKNGHGEPGPLRGAKEGNGIALNHVVMFIVPDANEFEKEQRFNERHEEANVQMTGVQNAAKGHKHGQAQDGALEYFGTPRFVLFDLVARHHHFGSRGGGIVVFGIGCGLWLLWQLHRGSIQFGNVHGIRIGAQRLVEFLRLGNCRRRFSGFGCLAAAAVVTGAVVTVVLAALVVVMILFPTHSSDIVGRRGLG
mmetsp:Transcript_10025/g.21920  ORF Transcript_10025/g.21920 Transcript_10025/m.21920 type:complete len:343 (+) Transcript_10025:816-1844(+)